MSVAHTSLKGNTFYDAYRAYNGLTLVVPADGTGLWLIDMGGRAVHRWDTGYRPAGHAELLPNGNILYAGRIKDNPLADIEGAGGVLLEMDWNGNVLWNHCDPFLHDGCFRTENGNTLAIKWVKVPQDIAGRVQGGERGTERDGVMWGDMIEEITPENKVVWSWVAHEHLDPKTDKSCPLCPRMEWTHGVSCLELADGNILICFRKNDAVVVIKKESGEIVWHWGPGELAHPQQASILDNGNVLIFDSGYHRAGINSANSRIVELEPYSGRIVWSYAEGANRLFYSSGLSNAQRLPNGNTFVCEGIRGRLFEVTAEGLPVWEYVNRLSEAAPDTGMAARHLQVCTTRRYGIEYSGLPGNEKRTQKKQAAPGTSGDSVKETPAEKTEGRDDEEAILDRLKQLGY
jgi:hypothetical protein